MKKKKIKAIDWQDDKTLEKIRQNLSNLSEMISSMASRTFIELADMRRVLADINYELFKMTTGKR